ncbi:hypothetical protein [Natronospora cellulosivora (SeqCode)]
MDIMKKMEEAFMNYAEKYDENIRELFRKRDLEISMEELDEILEDAKEIVKH